MISIDTNVLVRVLTNDDPEQAKLAMERLRSDTVWISRAVLLETEWVLRHAYGLDAGTIGNALTTVLAVPNIDVEDHGATQLALAWHAAGMDFADALHLATSRHADAFVSFDRPLAKVARRIGVKTKVESP